MKKKELRELETQCLHHRDTSRRISLLVLKSEIAMMNTRCCAVSFTKRSSFFVSVNFSLTIIQKCNLLWNASCYKLICLPALKK